MADIVNGDFETGTFSSWTKTALQNNKIPTVANHSIAPQSIKDLNMGASPADATLYPGTAPSDTTDMSYIASGTMGSVQDYLMNGYGATLRLPYDGNKSALINLDPGGKGIARTSGQPISGQTYTFHAKRGSSIKQRVMVASTDVDPSDGKVHIRFVFAPVLDNPGLLKQIGGTVTATNGSKNIVGVGTSFNSSVAIGDDIYFGTGTTRYTVATIASNTLLTVSSNVNASNAVSGGAAFTGPSGGHFEEEQPFFAVEVRKITSLTDSTPIAVTGAPASSPGQLFFTFNFSNQAGVSWGNVTNTFDSNLYTYSNFISIDTAPGNSKLAVGDTIEIEVIAAGCSKGGHEGHLYVDDISFHKPASLWVSATGPASVSSADGTTITYTYTYSNNGTGSVNNVVVTPVMPQDNSTVPQNSTFVSVSGASCSPSGGAAESPPTPGGSLSCSIGTLTAGQSGSFTMTINIPNSSTGPINNGNYTIAGTGANTLSGPLVQTSLVAPASLSDMSVSLAGMPTTGTAGSAYSGQYTCTNVGANSASLATCDAPILPAGVSVTGCVLTPGPASWTGPASVPAGSVVTCSVSGTTTTAGTITMRTTTDAGNDPNTANNVAAQSVTISAAGGPDLAISLSGLPATAQVGVAYSGSFTCTNSGAVSATAGTSCAVSSLPAGVTAGSCTIDTATPSVAWTSGNTIPVGNVVTCTVSGTPTTAGSVSVSGSTGAIGDTNSGNDTATATVTVAAAAAPDLAISLSGLPATAQVGVAYSGSFTCTNSGAVSATAGTSCAVSSLPAGVTAGSCTIDTATPSVAWTSGNTIPVGNVVTCTVSGTPTTAGSVSVSGSTGANGDSNAANDTAGKSIVVNSAFAPLAANDNAVTNYNTSVTISVSGNDSAGTGATLTLNSIDLDPATAGPQTTRSIAGEGVFVANSDGTVTFTPVSGFEGMVTVPYTIQSSLGLTSNVANITVTVRSSGNSGIPAAQNDYGSTTPITPVTLSVLSNDQASATNTLVNNSIVLSGTNIAQGTWVANPAGTVTFTPAAGFNGTATANYTVQDSGGGTSNAATITVTVGGGTQPAAQDDSASTKPSTAITIPVLSNDTPGSGNVLTPGSIALGGTTAANGTWVANASGTVTFTPANGFTGTAIANYTVQDSGGGTSNTAVISVTVNPVAPTASNDVAPSGIRTLTPASNDTASAGATLNPSTIDLDPSTPGIQRNFTVTGQGTWQVVDNNGTVRFSPVAGFYGVASLTYAVTDSLGNTATAIMSVSIDPSGVVYDGGTRTPIAGATVSLLYNGGSADSFVTSGNATMSTNSSGQYAFFLTPGAPAGTYSLTVSKAGYRFQSLAIPPAAGGWPAGGGAITAVVGPPTGAQSTLYFLSGPLPTMDIINNNIPLDLLSSLPGVVPVPTLSQWGLMILAGLMILVGTVMLRRRIE